MDNPKKLTTKKYTNHKTKTNKTKNTTPCFVVVSIFVVFCETKPLDHYKTIICA